LLQISIRVKRLHSQVSARMRESGPLADSSSVYPSQTEREAARKNYSVRIPKHAFSVYIMSNRSKTLYIGMTNNLPRRVWEHKQGIGSGFCRRYKLDRLVYFENFQYVGNAIAREKELKAWLRARKIALIVAENPAWRDLAEDWYDDLPRRA